MTWKKKINRRAAWVKAGAKHGWVPVADVKFIDICESFHGDEMTFEYEGETHFSLIISGSRPG